jgi:peroxiredoxin
MSQILDAGALAPGLTLSVTPDQNLSLGELRGKSVILCFCPADLSPVCGDQLALDNEVLCEFRRYSVEPLGLSVNRVRCHEKPVRAPRFPLPADFHPKGTAPRSCGAYRDSEGVCERALFVRDRDDVTFCSLVPVNLGADGILEALEQMSKKDDAHVHAQSASHAA